MYSLNIVASVVCGWGLSCWGTWFVSLWLQVQVSPGPLSLPKQKLVAWSWLEIVTMKVCHLTIYIYIYIYVYISISFNFRITSHAYIKVLVTLELFMEVDYPLCEIVACKHWVTWNDRKEHQFVDTWGFVINLLISTTLGV